MDSGLPRYAPKSAIADLGTEMPISVNPRSVAHANDSIPEGEARECSSPFPKSRSCSPNSVRRFAHAHLAQDALKRAHDPRFPFDVAKLMSAQGLMGITIPEADGGQGGTLMDAVIAIEQVAAVCPRSADVVQFGNFGPIRTFAEYGTDVSEEAWLPDCLAGNAW